MMGLRPRESTQKRNPPPGFLAKRTGAAAGDLLERMNPFSNCSLRYLRITLSYSMDVFKRGPCGGVVPGLRSIL